MKNIKYIIIALLFLSACQRTYQEDGLIVIDTFEKDFLTDNGCGNGAEIIVSTSNNAHSGKKALQITYDKSFGGYMFCARGFGLKPVIEIPQNKLYWDIKPENIDFNQYTNFGFFIKGQNTGNTIAIDIFDKDKEIFRYTFEDTSSDWRKITIPLSEFEQRHDYQPNWDNANNKIDFPIIIYQFEPLSGPNKDVKGTIIIDDIFFAKPKNIS